MTAATTAEAAGLTFGPMFETPAGGDDIDAKAIREGMCQEMILRVAAVPLIDMSDDEAEKHVRESVLSPDQWLDVLEMCFDRIEYHRGGLAALESASARLAVVLSRIAEREAAS